MAHKLIAVSEENFEILKKMGDLGDTYNDVITRLLQKSKAMEVTAQ
jgi:predicted CopG family antitoxin